jgi:hypothetical protein
MLNEINLMVESSIVKIQQKGARVMENDPGVRSSEVPVSPKQIKLVFLNWCAPPAGNPH